MIRQALFIVFISSVLGLGVNLVSPNAIEYVGHYRSLHSGEGPIVPPEAEAGDPPFIGVDVAEMEHSNYNTVFVDARDPAEFDCGTIPGSINIPFDYLPEENFPEYIDSALGGVEKDRGIIIFCSGEECDLSLHLGRNLQDLGYTNLSIFFGGSREWERFGLDVERRVECGE